MILLQLIVKDENYIDLREMRTGKFYKSSRSLFYFFCSHLEKKKYCASPENTKVEMVTIIAALTMNLTKQQNMTFLYQAFNTTK